MQTAATCAAVLVIAAILVSAGVSDVRTRRVSDPHWAALLLIGIPLAAMTVGADHGEAAAVAYGSASAMLGLYLLSPAVTGVPAAILLIGSGPVIAVAIGEGGGPGCAAAFCQYGIFVGLHLSGLLAGGADAKCLASLSLTVPAWAGEPFAVLSVAIAALAMSMAWVPAVSRLRGGGVSSYPCAVSDIDTVKEWPTGREHDGVASSRRPSHEGAEETVRRLRDLRIQEARVTPVIPFVAFVAAAFVLLEAGRFLT